MQIGAPGVTKLVYEVMTLMVLDEPVIGIWEVVCIDTELARRRNHWSPFHSGDKQGYGVMIREIVLF
jgi:hypothetical protein